MENKEKLPDFGKKKPNYHPGVKPGHDFIWGSDQDEYMEQNAAEPKNPQNENTGSR